MDAYISEIIVVIVPTQSGNLDKIVEQLKAAGVEVTSVNSDEGVVEGTVESYKLKEIQKLGGVDYVRTVFTYAAEYAPGDAGNRGGA